jgi:hypothetical protein
MVQPAPLPPHDGPGEGGQVPAIWLEPSPVRTKPSLVPAKRPALRALYCNRRAMSGGAYLLEIVTAGPRACLLERPVPYRNRVTFGRRLLLSRRRSGPAKEATCSGP